jgi:hypothetical protein
VVISWGRIAAREQPTLRARRLPPDPQQIEQARREHDVTVLAAFALLDADDHAFAVDVGDFERDHLGGAQTGAIGHAQRRLVLQPRRGIEQPRHLFDAEHHRQLARLVNDMGMLDDLVALERDLKEEPQRRDGLIDGRHANTACRQMELVAAHVLEARRIRRSPEERSEVLDPLHVVMLGLRRELADRHVFDHAPAQRAYCLVGHRDAPVLGEGCEPLISRQDAPLRYPVGCPACCSALPRERFSPMTLNGHRKWLGAAKEFEIRTGWRSWNDAETVKSDVPNRVLDQFLPTKAHTDRTPLPKLSALQSASS